MNIGAMATIDKYTDFNKGCRQAYRLFTRRVDLVGLVPQEIHANEDEFKAGVYPKVVELDGLSLPVKPHQMVPEKHVRVCAPEPEGEAVW